MGKKETFVLLTSERLKCPLAPAVRQTAQLSFKLNRRFVPRIVGYFDKDGPKKADIIRISWIQQEEDGSFTKPRKVGIWDFSSMDMSEIAPKVKDEVKIVDDGEEEEEELDEEEEDEDDDEDGDEDSSASNSKSSQNSSDVEYQPGDFTQNLNMCPRFFTWSPEQSLWTFKFQTDHKHQCLVLLGVDLKLVKKKETPIPSAKSGKTSARI